MITQKGYSKDPNIIPEGIALTMPIAFFEDRKMTYDEFRIEFETTLAQENGEWYFVKKNLPKFDVLFVYIIFDKKIQYRTNLVCFERNSTKSFADAPDQQIRTFEKKNWIILSGPAIKAPYDIPQKGFQGFRYTTKLF